jgi:hypothetical protein
MSKRDDTFTGTATRVARCGSLLEGLRLSYAQARWTQEFLSGLGCRSIKPYIHWYCIVVCVVLFKPELNLFGINICPILL